MFLYNKLYIFLTLLYIICTVYVSKRFSSKDSKKKVNNLILDSRILVAKPYFPKHIFLLYFYI